MIKHLIALGFITGLTFSLSAQTTFTIKGKLKDTSRNGEKLTISYFNGEKKVYAPVLIKDGVYSIEGTIMEPTKASLSINTTKEERKDNPWVTSEKVEFYIEGGEITVTGLPLAKAVVKGPGKSQKEWLALQKKLKPFLEKEKSSWNDMLHATAKRDSVNKQKFNKLNETAKQQIDSVELAFLSKNPASHVSLGLLRDKVTTKSLAEDKEKYAALYSPLAEILKQTIVGKKLGEQIETAFKLGPGKESVDFVLNDTLGNPVRLSSFRGKYVLLDFWASWCIPCRFENPHVVKAYNRFKDKNFTVLSVSLEKPGDRKAWVDAIVKDGLPWNHVATLTKEDMEKIWQLYNIQSIPMNYLIDPNGKIVAVYLRGEALQKKLEEVL